MSAPKEPLAARVGRAFLSNRHLLLLTIVVVLAAGFSGVSTLPRQEDPRLSNWWGFVQVVFPGASATRVESLVTKPIENRLREIEEIGQIESTSQRGVAVLTIEIDNRVLATEEVWSRVRDKLADFDRARPDGVNSPLLDHERTKTAFTRVVALRDVDPTNPDVAILGRWAEEIAERLRNVSGTDLVRVHGAPDEEIKVTVSPTELSALGLDVAELARRIERADSKLAAGVLRGSGREAVIEVEGELSSVDRIGRIPVDVEGAGTGLRLRDIAVVERGFREPWSEIALANGERVVQIAIRMAEDRRIDQWNEKIDAVLDDYRDVLGGTATVDTVFDQSTYTNERLLELAGNLLLGAALVVLVLFFIMGWRSALLVGSALPVVSCIVLFTLQVVGIPLHQMSVTGLIISLGLLIDNAIVIVDEMRARSERGASATTAMRETAQHLFVPLLGSTSTTVLAFMPILLLQGAIGQFVGAIALSVIIAVAASFLFSVFLLPAFAALFGFGDLSRRGVLDRGLHIPALSRAFRGAVRLFSTRPAIGIAVALILPVAGFIRMPLHRSQFFPPSDRNQFEIEVDFPTATSIDETRDRLASLDDQIRGTDGVERVDWLVGGSFPTVYYNLLMDQIETPDYAHGIVTMQSPERSYELARKWQKSLRTEWPDAQIVIREFAQGPPVAAPVDVRIYGANLTELRRIAEEVRRRLSTVAGVLETKQSLEGGQPKVWFEADEVELARAGLTLADIANELQTSFEGIPGGSVLEDTESIPVRIRYPETSRSDVDSLRAMNVRVGQGHASKWVPLSAFGTFRTDPVMEVIPRRDGERYAAVTGYIEADALPLEVSGTLAQSLADEPIAMGPGYRIEFAGENEEQGEAIGALVAYLPILALLMVSVIVLSFRSFGAAFLLGGVAGLTFGLGSLAIALAGYPYGFMAMIGTAGLIGVAVNDSIVVLASLHSNPRARAGDIDAMVDEVVSCSRHVVSTTLTTMVGFLPLILAGGGFWPPLAIVIAGGVAGATLLAVTFVPAVHTILCRIEARFLRARTSVEIEPSAERSPA